MLYLIRYDVCTNRTKRQYLITDEEYNIYRVIIYENTDYYRVFLKDKLEFVSI